MTRRKGGLPALAFGVRFALAGLALFLQELDVLTLRWTYVVLFILVMVGVVVLVSGLVGRRESQPPTPPPAPYERPT